MFVVDDDLVLEARQLRRRYGGKGAPWAVDGLDLSIARGETLALLGPNGAGKTTTVQMCAAQLAPTSGSVVVDGIDAVSHPRQARGRLGVVLGGDAGFYGRATARQNLLFFADAMGVRRQDRFSRVGEALAAVRLTERADERVNAYSRGMRQRLHIARSLLTYPKLLLLDEPTNGLDPEIAREIRSLVADLSQQGVAILLTTHDMREAEQLADRISVIVSGRLAVSGSVVDIAHHAGVTEVSMFSLNEFDAEMRSRVSGIELVDGIRVDRRDGRDYVGITWSGRSDVVRLASVIGPVEDLHTRAPTLEESYLKIMTGVS